MRKPQPRQLGERDRLAHHLAKDVCKVSRFVVDVVLGQQWRRIRGTGFKPLVGEENLERVCLPEEALRVRGQLFRSRDRQHNAEREVEHAAAAGTVPRGRFGLEQVDEARLSKGESRFFRLLVRRCHARVPFRVVEVEVSRHDEGLVGGGSRQHRWEHFTD